MPSLIGRTILAALVGAMVISTAAARTARPPEWKLSLHEVSFPRNGLPRRVHERRPVIVVLASNSGTETTDFFIPYGILKGSGVADVFAVSTKAGAVQFMPALEAELPETISSFNTSHPQGADYVIIPALHDSRDPEVLAFIRDQVAHGATVVGICSGAKVLSEAGLLEGHAATGHWMDIPELRRKNPTMRWVRDRRYVIDRRVITTTGVTASVPFSIALVERISGHERAAALARAYGLRSWGTEHDSSLFSLRPHLRTIALNTTAFWRHETLALPVSEGVDDVALALTADAYSRTYRSQVWATARAPRVRTRSGLMLSTRNARTTWGSMRTLPAVSSVEPVRALDEALEGITRDYGGSTARWVAAQIEYSPAGGADS